VNHLFRNPDPDPSNFASDLNPESLEVLTDCLVEPAAAASNSAEPMQFERQGYFVRDGVAAARGLVFIRTVGLRDTYAKVLAQA
jgi:glutaminyl-tRNA synthetase